jgi:hypothetical protein
MNIVIFVLQFLALRYGIKALRQSAEYGRQKKRMKSLAMLLTGILLCACALLSLAGVI